MPNRFLNVLTLALPFTLAVGLVVGCEKQEPTTETPEAPATGDVAEANETAEVAADISPELVVELPELPEFESVHDVMEEIEDHYRFLRRNSDTAETAEMLEHAGMIRALALAAQAMTPHVVEDAPEAERAAVMATYQEHMDKVGPAIDVLEAAIRADDREAIKAAVHEVHELEEHGHEALGVDD